MIRGKGSGLRLVRMRKVAAILAAAVLVPAVPVAALTFLTPWTIQRAFHNAPKSSIARRTWRTGTSLLINMNKANPLNSQLERYSRVIAQRWFRVGPTPERISFTHTFKSLIQNARVVVRATIQGFGPRATRFVRLRPIAEASIGPNPRTVSTSDSITTRLGPGKYKIRIYIQYRNIRNGYSSWENEAPPAGSAHKFTLQAL